MAWSSAVITNSGLAILPQLITGSEMILDTAKLASGTVEAVSLIAQTSLSSPIDEIPVVIAAKSNIENGIAIKLQIRNTGLPSAETFKQIGLYATYNETQVLFAIAQDDIGEEVPSETDYPDYMLEFTMAVAVSQTDEITVTVNPSAVVTAGTLAEQLALYTPTEAMNTSIEAVYNRSTEYTDLQITLLINGSPAELDTLKELADAMLAHRDIVEALNAAIGNKAPKEHEHAIEDVTGLQTALEGKAPVSHGTHVTYATAAPKSAGTAAVGTSARVAREDHVHPAQTSVSGDAGTVNGHTVNSDVPANAKFTDTVYTHPSYTARTGVPTAAQTPAFGGTFAVNQVVCDATGHVTAVTSRNVTIPSTAASASAAGLVNTGAQTFAGNKTFNGQILPNGATAYGTPQARKLASGTAAATTTNCPSGAWLGQHA